MNTRSSQGLFASLLLVGCCLIGPDANAANGYYKWMDERGNPHHSDRPPPSGVEYEFISTDTGMRRRIGASSSAGGSSAPSMPTSAPETTTVAERQTQIKKIPEYCDQAKANLDTLNSTARVRIRGPNGEIKYLNEEEKADQRVKARDLMAIHCN